MSDDSMAEAFDELAPMAVAAGIVVFALFPLALPLIALTLLVAIPVAAIGLVAGVLAAPIVLIRRLTRSPEAP